MTGMIPCSIQRFSVRVEMLKNWAASFGVNGLVGFAEFSSGIFILLGCRRWLSLRGRLNVRIALSVDEFTGGLAGEQLNNAHQHSSCAVALTSVRDWMQVFHEREFGPNSPHETSP
jgi:hypothetical protein